MLRYLRVQIGDEGLRVTTEARGEISTDIKDTPQVQNKLLLLAERKSAQVTLDITIAPTSDGQEIKNIQSVYTQSSLTKPYLRNFAEEKDVGALKQGKKSVVHFIRGLLGGISPEEKQLILQRCTWIDKSERNEQTLFDHFIISIAIYYSMYDLFLQSFFWSTLPTRFNVPLESLSVEILYKNSTDYLYDLLQMLSLCATDNVLSISSSHMLQFINLWGDAFPEGKRKFDMRRQSKEVARCYHQFTAHTMGKMSLILSKLQQVEKIVTICENTNKRIDKLEGNLKELQALERRTQAQLVQVQELSRGAEERERSAYERELSTNQRLEASQKQMIAAPVLKSS